MIFEPASISVVVPAHDRAEQVDRALAAVRAQTLAPAEVIVVDDASTDGTAAVAERLGARVLRQEHNRGAAAARNRGVSAASGDWIALLDSDDEWLPFHLETLWRARGDHVLVAGSALAIDAAGRRRRTHGPPGWRDLVLSSADPLVFPENFIPASAAMVRRAALERVGGYDTTLRYAEDFDLWTRLVQVGSFRCLATVTVRYRRHAGQKSRGVEGPKRAQEAIVARTVALGEASARSARRRIGARAWDDVLLGVAHRDPARAASGVRAVASSPDAIAGVLWHLGWRARVRRRARMVTGDGRSRVALLDGELSSLASGAPGATPRAEDWRSRSAVRQLARLTFDPPRVAATGSDWRATACRVLGIELTGSDPADAAAGPRLAAMPIWEELRGRDLPAVSSARPPVRILHPGSRVQSRIGYRQLGNALVGAARSHASGRLLDIGCGSKPWAPVFAPYVTEHLGVDHPDSPHPDDAVDLSGTAYEVPLASETVDTVLMTEVLEHLEEPVVALREAHRLLAPGGALIVTTPFMWPLHELPRDFFRYSPRGLTHVLEAAGFQDVEVTPLSGQWGTLAMLGGYALLPYRRGILRPAVDAVSILAQIAARGLDRLHFRADFSWNHLAVARRW